jgi:hypothetical protein
VPVKTLENQMNIMGHYNLTSLQAWKKRCGTCRIRSTVKTVPHKFSRQQDRTKRPHLPIDMAPYPRKLRDITPPVFHAVLQGTVPQSEISSFTERRYLFSPSTYNAIDMTSLNDLKNFLFQCLPEGEWTLAAHHGSRH